VRSKGYDLARYSCSTIVDMNFGVSLFDHGREAYSPECVEGKFSEVDLRG
jgi:hypothetical protein